MPHPCFGKLRIDNVLSSHLLDRTGFRKETPESPYTENEIKELTPLLQKASEEIQAEDISSLKDMYGKLGIEKYKPTPQAPASTVDEKYKENLITPIDKPENVSVGKIKKEAGITFISQEKQDAIQESVGEEGVKVPIIVNKDNGDIIDGSHRLAAAQAAGQKNIPVIYVRGMQRMNEIGGAPELIKAVKEKYEQAPVKSGEEKAVAGSGVQAIVKFKDNTPDLKDVPLNTIEENLNIGDTVHGNIMGENISGKVTDVGVHKGQIVVDITDQNGNQRFLYSKNIERIDPKPKELERLTDEQNKRYLELINKDETTSDEMSEMDKLGKMKRGEIPNTSKELPQPQTTPSKLPKGEGQAELPIGGETKNIINETIQEGDSREVTHGVIGRVGKFVSRVFGGKPSEKVFVAKDEKSLINKANELQKEGGDVKYMFKEAVIGAVAMLQPMKISESKAVRTEQTTKFQSKDERAVIDILNNYYKENNETPPQEVIDRTLYLWDKFGRPEISGDSTKKDERAFATYEGGKVKIGNITNFDDFIAELSHSAQYVSGKKMDNREYATEALRDSIEYKRKGSMENKAHTLIEPILARYIFNGDSAELNKIQYQKKDGNILGFTHNGKIYLNGENLNPETPIHEAGHIWTEWTKQNDSKLYNKGIELINGSKYLKSIKEDSFYQIEANKLPASEREQYLQHEALAQAIGDKGAQFVSESKKAGFKEWLNNLWSNIKSAAGFKDLSNKEFQNLTLDEFSKRAAKDILDEKPTIQEGTEGTKSKPSKESSQPKKLATETGEGAGQPPTGEPPQGKLEEGDGGIRKRFKEWAVIDKDKTITQDVKGTHEIREGAELLNEDYQRLQRDKAATDLSMDLLIQDAKAQLGDGYLDFVLDLAENGGLELETRNAIMQSLLWRQGLSPDIVNILKAIDKKLATKSQDNFMIRRSLSTQDEISDEQNDMIESALGDEGVEVKTAKEVLDESFSNNEVDEKTQSAIENKTVEELNEEIADLRKQLQEAKEGQKPGKVDIKKFKAKAEMVANNLRNKDGNGFFDKIIKEINEIAKKC